MTLERVYKDLILLSVLIGLIVVSIIALYVYFTTYDTRILVFGIVIMLLGVLTGVATYVFRVEFLWTILKNWRKN